METVMVTQKSFSLFRLCSLATLFAVVFALAPKAHAQSGKIGWVDLDKILSEYKEFKEAENLFQKDAAVWEATFDSLQAEYLNKLEDYRKQRLILTDETRKARETELASMEQNLMQTKAKFENDAERRRAELTTPILKKIQDVVQRVAVSEDFDYVLNGSQNYLTSAGIQFSPIMYAKDKLDLTDRIFEELAKLK
jgi:outer membrane protein